MAILNSGFNKEFRLFVCFKARFMNADMFTLSKYFKIFYTIVKWIIIDMMDYFYRIKKSMYMLFHNQSVLFYITLMRMRMIRGIYPYISLFSFYPFPSGMVFTPDIKTSVFISTIAGTKFSFSETGKTIYRFVAYNAFCAYFSTFPISRCLTAWIYNCIIALARTEKSFSRKLMWFSIYNFVANYARYIFTLFHSLIISLEKNLSSKFHTAILPLGKFAARKRNFPVILSPTCQEAK